MERRTGSQDVINNDFYETLGDEWYTATDHPIALLRAENRLRTRWIAEDINKYIGPHAKVLDVGCGAGFLTNYLSLQGFDVTGVDLSQSSLDVAKRYDETKRVQYLLADAYKLPFADGSFDVVCAMDILEHVDDPAQLISEASRVLTPGGRFFFHTFNRNFFSYFMVIKGVDWFVKNAPPHMHVYRLFIKPSELKTACKSQNLELDDIRGFVPNMFTKSFWKMLWTRQVPEDFQFTFTKCLATGYCGSAVKPSLKERQRL